MNWDAHPRRLQDGLQRWHCRFAGKFQQQAEERIKGRTSSLWPWGWIWLDPKASNVPSHVSWVSRCHSVTDHFLALGVASDVALSLLPVPADITCFANGVAFKRVVLWPHVTGMVTRYCKALPESRRWYPLRSCDLNFLQLETFGLYSHVSQFLRPTSPNTMASTFSLCFPAILHLILVELIVLPLFRPSFNLPSFLSCTAAWWRLLFSNWENVVLVRLGSAFGKSIAGGCWLWALSTVTAGMVVFI